jgi:NADH:ubiquinone oxidoreductase subunit
MTIVTEYDWQSDTFTHHTDTPARQAWRAAVTEIAERAKQTLPEANGRVDKAVALVLAGDVELLADGKAKVASQSNGTAQYVVCNGTCECKDFPKAPSGWCKHRIAAGMQKRALALVQQKLSAGANGHAEAPSQPAQPTAALPEAPVSIVRRIGDVEECYQCNQECWDFLYIPTLSLPAMA